MVTRAYARIFRGTEVISAGVRSSPDRDSSNHFSDRSVSGSVFGMAAAAPGSRAFLVEAQVHETRLP